MQRLLSSSSPIEESCTSFAVVQGITKTNQFLYPSTHTGKKKHKSFSLLTLSASFTPSLS
jgi:hypothetical protein